MDIYYVSGSEEIYGGVENPSTRMLRREGARSLGQEGMMEPIALQEAISLARLGVASRLRIQHESYLKDPVSRAVACAETMAIGVPVIIGEELVTANREPGDLQALACEVARERSRLLPPAGGTIGGGTYISPGWPSDEECARLAHKLVYEMGYSQADVARIFETVDGYERPAMWTRQGINRILWEECDGEKYPRYHYRKESGVTSRRAGRLHLPGASFNAMAVLGDERAEVAAKKFDAVLTEPHHCILPVDARHSDRGLAWLLQMVIEVGAFRTLYVSSSDAVFSSPTQRRVVYDLALFRGVQVVEDGTRIDAVAGDPHYNRLLREGTELSVALWARDNATIVEESRCLAHAGEEAAGWRSQGFSLREIAAKLNEEAIPTSSGKGAWSASAVRKLLGLEQEADR